MKMKIVSLEVSNVKRISFAEVHLDGSLVTIGGMNEQGKSSLIDSIKYLYGGKKSMPPEPLRRGEDAGYIKGVEANGWVTIRRFQDDKTSLEVRDDKGRLQKKPQDICDAKCGAISFDPLSFARMKKAEQGETLMALKGLDFSDLDASRQELEQNRLMIGRDVAKLKGAIAEAGTPSTDAVLEVSSAGLSAELERRLEKNAENKAKRDRLKEIADEYRGIQAEILAAQQHLKILEDEGKVLKVEVPELVEQDAEEIRTQLASVDVVNAAVRGRIAFDKQKAELELQEEAYADHSNELKGIKQERVDRLSATPWPIEGLGIGEDGDVTYKGLPFDAEQLSSKQIARVSAAIGFSLAPEPDMLHVMLIKNASLFDKDAMAELAAEAKRVGWLVLAEVVGEDGDIVIEDGMVKV